MKIIDRAIRSCDFDPEVELADKISKVYRSNQSKIDNWLDKNVGTEYGIGDLNLSQLKRLASFLGIKY